MFVVPACLVWPSAPAKSKPPLAVLQGVSVSAPAFAWENAGALIDVNIQHDPLYIVVGANRAY